MPTALAASSPQLPDKGELTTSEVAQAIGWTEGSLRVSRCKADSGMVPPPHIKRGTAVVYPRDDLVRWMRARGYSPGFVSTP